MTYQTRHCKRNRLDRNRHRVEGLLVAVSMVLVVVTGCGKDEAPAPTKPVARAAPPPPPPPPSIQELADEMQIDLTVIRFDEEDAPESPALRRAILEFFDGWYRGDSETVLSMVGSSDREELKAMVADGQWKSSTAEIDAIFISSGLSPSGDQCVLAIYEVGVQSQPQLWQIDGEGNNVRFEAVPTPPEMMSRLSGDMVAGWFEILNEEKELWAVPDAQLSMLDEDEEEADAGVRPSGPAAGGGRRPGGNRRSPGGRY